MAAPLDHYAMASRDEAQGVRQIHGRIQDRNLEFQRPQLRLIHRQEPGVVQRGRGRGVADVLPERGFETHEADAAAQAAPLVDRDEGGGGLGQRPGERCRDRTGDRATADSRLDRSPGDGEE